jgi:hypothetical protein
MKIITLIQLTLAVAFVTDCVMQLPAAAHSTSNPIATTKLMRAPFVGCAGDGMSGPFPAPSDDGKSPLLSPYDAAALAYYSVGDWGVLAPRGWHCFDSYGSDGAVLTISPRLRSANDLPKNYGKLAGPMIVMNFINGGTSGRFEAAHVAARIFPIARPFVQGVINEQLEPASHFSFTPYPYDIVTRLDPNRIEFETPAQTIALGTRIQLAPDANLIRGIAILESSDPPNILVLNVRLPSDLRYLTPIIVDNFRRAQESASKH